MKTDVEGWPEGLATLVFFSVEGCLVVVWLLKDFLWKLVLRRCSKGGVGDGRKEFAAKPWFLIVTDIVGLEARHAPSRMLITRLWLI